MLLSSFTITLIMLATIATKTNAINVPKYCKLGCTQPHVVHGLCANPNKELIDRCGRNTKIISLKKSTNLILTPHNHLRMYLASGNETKYPTASRMGEMFWDPDLAELAEYSARRCFISDPYCYATPKYPEPGRSANIVKVPRHEGDNREVDYADVVDNNILLWLRTGKDLSREMVASFPSNVRKHQDFFGRAVMDRNNQVGCAVATWIDKKWDIVLLVCLYSHNVVAGKRLYKIGRGGSSCLNGKSKKYKNLCSVNEDYTINNENPKGNGLNKGNKRARPKRKFNAPEGGLWTLMVK